MKACIKCGVVKGLEEFPKRKPSGRGLRRAFGDGHRGECNACHRIMATERRAKTKGRIHEYYITWRNKDPDNVRAIGAKARKKRYAEKRDEVLADQRARYKKNPEAYLGPSRMWRANNPDHTRVRYAKNPEKYRAKNRARYAENPRDGINRTMRYMMRKKNAMPNWLTPEQIAKIDQYYDWRDLISQETGIEHHVDHIVPLRGKSVCGLHVPWNLQILTATENKIKNNRFSSEGA